MSRYATIKSDAQLNAEALRKRERPNYERHNESRIAKAERAQNRPQSFGQLLGWFHREWDADFAAIVKLHEHGVEPDSQLGAPATSGPMKSRIRALDRAKSALQTDYDPDLDTWSTGEAPLWPMLNALARYRRKAPILARYLEAVAYGGFDWRHVGEKWLRVRDGERFIIDDEHIFVVTNGALGALWGVWSAGQRDAGKGEVA